ncbi:TauD/TfdA family dioxygenase [Sphingobacterium sp. lm-10]|uniref:TauD/TfdA dioxygenase family protein n=1 Tax=Sphingobacterium sp. lm-10 TaxID=2944904 RepID=UPI0020223362|nr:TauD/TfdA family dioxygenase [Sphingobacterium sp. lm-10]MCL7989427.1 TauD/TfdA family dioxygenase [Sphingobacterium sp. lm-10]
MKKIVETLEYEGAKSFGISRRLNNIGIEINGVDLKELNADEIQFIKQLLAQESLIIFRNQALDDKDLVSFAEKVGNGKLEPSASKINHGRQYKEVGYITNLKDQDGNYIGFHNNTTDFWHSDQEFRENPASIGVLFCLIPPEIEGQTSFVSTTTDFFSQEFIEMMRPLLSSRLPATFHDNILHQKIAHPVILTNPLTHKAYVYVSENTIDLLDSDLNVQPHKKEELLEVILHPDNIYKHDWKSGDTILYDNTQLLHRRESYGGIRFLKALKIYPDPEFHTKITGRVIL